ncbi:MAG: MBG domain-containing protein [Isosphaeraceae bacterium]
MNPSRTHQFTPGFDLVRVGRFRADRLVSSRRRGARWPSHLQRNVEALEARCLLSMNPSFAVGSYVASSNTAYFPPYADLGVFSIKATGSFDLSTHFSCVVNWGDGSDPESIGSSYIVSDGFMSGFSSTHSYPQHGAYTVSATLSDSLGDKASVTCTYLMVATDTLVFTQQPTGGVVNGYFGPVEVSAEYGPDMIDDGFNYVAGTGYRYGGDVTFSLVNASGATLSGTKVVHVRDGVAHTYLMVDQPGTYQIRASAPGTVDALSEPFDVVGTDTIRFAADPPTTAPTGSLAPVRVQVLKPGALPEVGVGVSLVLNSANGATLTGTTTAITDASGIATFDDLSIKKPGAGYTFTASSLAAGSVTSSKFALVGDTLSFVNQPPETAPAGALAPVKLKLLRSDKIPDNGVEVTLSLHGGSGALSGTTKVVTDDEGIATFDDLRIDRPGEGYTLTASADVAEDVTSNPFTLTREALTWSGGGDGLRWSDADNWKEKLAPSGGDSLVFPTGDAPRTTLNDIAGLSVSTIELEGTGYDLTGSPLTITRRIDAAGDNTIDLSTVLSGSVAIDVSAGTLAFKDALSGDGSLTISGSASGKIGLFDGEALLGVTTVKSGTLELGGPLTRDVVVDGGLVVLLAGLSGEGGIDVRKGVLFSDHALPDYAGIIQLESLSNGGNAGDRAQAVVESNDALGIGEIQITAGAGNYPVIQASGAAMTRAGSLVLDNNLRVEAGTKLGFLGSIQFTGQVGLEGDSTFLPQPGATVAFADDLGYAGTTYAGGFASHLIIAPDSAAAKNFSVRFTGSIAADTQIKLTEGAVALGGELEAAVEAVDQVLIDGAEVDLLAGLKGDGGILVRKGTLFSDVAVPDYEGDVTIASSATGNAAGDRAQVVVEADEALGEGVIHVAAGAGNWGVLQASGAVMSKNGFLTLSNPIQIDAAAELGVLGIVKLGGDVFLEGEAGVLVQPTSALTLAGTIQSQENASLSDTEAYASRLVVQASHASGAGQVTIAGALADDVQLELRAGKVLLNGNLGGELNATDQVLIDGAMVDLGSSLQGTGSIDVRSGVLFSNHEIDGFSGTVTLEASAEGGRPGDRAQVVVEADNGLGTGRIHVLASEASGHFPVLQGTADALAERGAVRLDNPVLMDAGARLGLLQAVQLDGVIELAGEVTVLPQAGSTLILNGELGFADDSAVAMTSTTTDYAAHLFVSATGGAAGTGSVWLGGKVRADTRVVFEAGENRLGAELGAAVDASGQVLIDGAKVFVIDGLKGTGGVDVRLGVLASDVALPDYSGTITIESDASGGRPGDRAQVVAEVNQALGTGTIRVASGAGTWGVLQASGDVMTELGAITLGNVITIEDGAKLGLIGALRIAGDLTLAGNATLLPQAEAEVELAGAIRSEGGVATAAAGAFASQLTVAATPNAASTGMIRVTGNVSSDVQLIFEAGKDWVGGTLGASAETLDQVRIAGAEVYLSENLQGDAGIKLERGILFSDHATPGFRGTLTLEASAKGDKPGDRAQAVFEANEAFGLGALVIAIGPGNFPVLQASGDLMTETGRLTLSNSMRFEGAAVLGVHGQVRLAGPVGLDGVATVLPQASAWLELAGEIGGGSVAIAAAGGGSSGFVGRLVIAATEGATATGSVTVTGPLASDAQLSFEAGEAWLGGPIHAPVGTSDQVVVDGAKVHLSDGFEGTGGIDVLEGKLRSDQALPHYHGAITIEHGQVIVSVDNALGDGPILKSGDGPGVIYSDTPGTDPVVNNPLSVQAGTLILRGLLTFPQGVTVGADGTVVVDGSDTLLVWPSVVDGGGLIVLKGGTLRITSSNNPFTGSVEQAGGAIELLGVHSLRSTNVGLSSDHATGATYGAVVTLTANVVAIDPSIGTPTGTLQFLVDGAPLGAPVPLSGGKASQVVHLNRGSHVVTARYLSDDALFANGRTLSELGQAVAPAPLTVTVNPASKAYGSVNPGFTVDYAGFVNGETTTALAGTLVFQTLATPRSHVGDYVVTASGLTGSNYAIAFVPGTLSVMKAPLLVMANNATMTAGSSVPALSASYVGWVNGDNAASLTHAAVLTTNATPSSPAGVYAIKAAGAVSADYMITYQDGTLTITGAPLTPLARARAAFVTTLYQQILGRRPEASGLAFWTGRLAAGLSPQALASSIWRSREHVLLLAAHRAPGIRLDTAYRNAVRAYTLALQPSSSPAALPAGPLAATRGDVWLRRAAVFRASRFEQ